jgi:glyoxylase-like metal-dependent hydrolase (beta-lactamase superfamily II)
MTAPTVDVLIHPVCLRFRWERDEIVYFFASNPEAQLDRMEQMLGIGPGEQPIFRTNLGFLPVASTVLIRGEKTVLVDPGNHHIGSYSILWHALKSRGLSYDDIDLVVTTHTHTDHAAAIVQLAGKPWLLSAGELASMAAIEGAPIVAAKKSMMGPITEIDAPTPVMAGVTAHPTPGHTPGHICLSVDTDSGRVLIAGDLTMLRSEWEERAFSQWYGPEQLAQLNASLDAMQALSPDLVIPGHDRPFRPGAR